MSINDETEIDILCNYMNHVDTFGDILNNNNYFRIIMLWFILHKGFNPENYDLACTCCGIRSLIIPKSDTSAMWSRKAITGGHQMITKISTVATTCSVVT